MHKQWNIISRDFRGLERNLGIKIRVKMTRDPGTEPLPKYDGQKIEKIVSLLMRYVN